jgi:IS5 family transposase
MRGKKPSLRYAEGFASCDYEQSTARKRTKRGASWVMWREAVVPWKALLDLIEPYYPKTGSKGGRPPYPLETSCGST